METRNVLTSLAAAFTDVELAIRLDIDVLGRLFESAAHQVIYKN